MFVGEPGMQPARADSAVAERDNTSDTLVEPHARDYLASLHATTPGRPCPAAGRPPVIREI